MQLREREREREMKVAASVANSANYDACQLRSACQLPLDEAEYNAPMNYDNCQAERERERGGSLTPLYHAAYN